MTDFIKQMPIETEILFVRLCDLKTKSKLTRKFLYQLCKTQANVELLFKNSKQFSELIHYYFSGGYAEKLLCKALKRFRVFFEDMDIENPLFRRNIKSLSWLGWYYRPEYLPSNIPFVIEKVIASDEVRLVVNLPPLGKEIIDGRLCDYIHLYNILRALPEPHKSKIVLDKCLKAAVSRFLGKDGCEANINNAHIHADCKVTGCPYRLSDYTGLINRPFKIVLLLHRMRNCYDFDLCRLTEAYGQARRSLVDLEE